LHATRSESIQVACENPGLKSETWAHPASPDPYSGSYDFNNPQSFKRYSYVMNNPLAFNDPSGLDGCGPWCQFLNGVGPIAAGLAILDGVESLFGGGPTFHGSLKPRPSTRSDPGGFGESLGIPASMPQGNWGSG
jgi:hypothetical protein